MRVHACPSGYKEQQPKKKKTAAESQIEAAGDCYKRTVAWTIEQQWVARMRTRDFETLCSRLGNHGRKMAAILDNDAAADLSDKLFQLEAYLIERQTVCTGLRDEFCTFVVEELTGQRSSMLRLMTGKLVAQIVASSVTACIESVTRMRTAVEMDAIVAAFWNATRSRHPKFFGLSFVFNDDAAVAAAQRTLVLSLAEKVLKGAEPETAILLGH